MKPSYFVAAFTPSKVIQARLHKRTIMQFAEKIGLVYFGYVDQRNDDHRLIRGLTVSAKHHDNNYCIGSFEGYDITLVERSDKIEFPGKPTKYHEWTIMTFDLHANVDIPHIFMGLHTHGEAFYAQLFTKFSALSRVSLGTLGVYEGAFAQKYALFSSPSQALSAERLFNPELAKKIVDQFGSFTLEISDGVLYIYAEHQRMTTGLLEKMLSNGLWIARALDEGSAKI